MEYYKHVENVLKGRAQFLLATLELPHLPDSYSSKLLVEKFGTKQSKLIKVPKVYKPTNKIMWFWVPGPV